MCLLLPYAIGFFAKLMNEVLSIFRVTISHFSLLISSIKFISQTAWHAKFCSYIFCFTWCKSKYWFFLWAPRYWCSTIEEHVASSWLHILCVSIPICIFSLWSQTQMETWFHDLLYHCDPLDLFDPLDLCNPLYLFDPLYLCPQLETKFHNILYL